MVDGCGVGAEGRRPSRTKSSRTEGRNSKKKGIVGKEERRLWNVRVKCAIRRVNSEGNVEEVDSSLYQGVMNSLHKRISYSHSRDVYGAAGEGCTGI
jgi:hypothetical protein